MAMRGLRHAATTLPVLLFGLNGLESRAQDDAPALLERARSKILENAAKLPRYTCVQTVIRSRFEPYSGTPARGCDGFEDEGAGDGRPRRVPAWTDQFRLDVTVAEGREIFSWAGAREFQSSDVQEIVGGGLTGSGDFGPFLMDIFGSRETERRYAGLEQAGGRTLAEYRYVVPLTSSRYQMKLDARTGTRATLAYEGRFWIDTRTAELRRMTIAVREPPAGSETCRVETTIDYRRVPIGGAPVLLPERTLLRLWDADGARHENQIAYSECRAFHSESTFRPEAANDAPVMPTPPAARLERAKPGAAIGPGLKLQIALDARMDASRAFAGDAVRGRLLEAVRGRNRRILIPEGTIVHGRIVRLEHHVRPLKYFVLGLKFDALELEGGEVPVALEMAPQSRQERILNGDHERRQGIGLFVFRGDRLVLDSRFVSHWKTARGRPSD
jgi:hypothetical protein